MKRFFLCLGIMLFVLSTTRISQGTLINFETDTAGVKSNGFTSNSSPVVHFSDSNGQGLSIGNYGYQGDGLSLSVSSDYDDSWLIMDFDIFADSLSIAFGNDDDGYSYPGDLAILTLFNGVNQVGVVSTAMNRNDIMDQVLSFSGTPFNRATFYYDVNPSVGLIEIVDNVEFTEAAPVPEPSTYLLFLFGMLGMAGVKMARGRKEII